MEQRKWYYHCPICRNFVLKDENRKLTERADGSVQCWHKNCREKRYAKVTSADFEALFAIFKHNCKLHKCEPEIKEIKCYPNYFLELYYCREGNHYMFHRTNRKLPSKK